MRAPDVLLPRAVRASQLVYPGSVTFSANLDAVRHFVREVLPLVRRVRSDVTFVVTGSTEGVEIADLAACEGVTFTGHLPDVGALVMESAACVVPLRIGGGTRLKVLQAMALGTPVVSTEKGIEGLDVEPERHVLVADGRESFAAQVLRVLSEPVLAEALSTNGHRLVRKRYGWDAIGDAGVGRLCRRRRTRLSARHTASLKTGFPHANSTVRQPRVLPTHRHRKVQRYVQR